MDAWRTILETAILSPSPHNVQPWRLRLVDAYSAELFIEKKRTLPDEDKSGSFIVLTMGLFIEAMRLVAAHLGLAIHDEPIHDFDWYTADHLRSRPESHFPFARLSLRPDPALRPVFPLELFRARRTSRLQYRREPVPGADGARLAALAANWGHRYHQRTDARTIEQLLAFNVEAVFEDVNHAPYRNELRRWLRYSPAQTARYRDGLDASCMNASPFELWLTFHAPKLLQLPPTRAWLSRRYRRQIGPVATMGFLCGRFWEPRDAFAAGRLLIHFWLECTRLGYYLHPYGNLVTNRRVASRVETSAGFSDIWLAFKIGRSDPPPRSERRRVEDVLID